MIELSPLLEGMRRRLANQSSQQSSALPLAALVVAGLGLATYTPAGEEPGTRISVIPVAHAGSSGSYDDDGDGLSNMAEKVLGSSRYIIDTDADGYPDMEEFARDSDPDDPSSIPLPGSLAIAMSASGEQDGLRLQIATYYTDNDYSNKNFQFGLMVNGAIRPILGLLDQPGVNLTRGTTMGNSGGVMLMEIPFSESLVHTVTQISIFVTLNVDGSPVIDAAAGIDLLSVDNVLMIIQDGPAERWNSFQTQSQGGGSGGQGPNAGSVYNPIPPGGGGVPNEWIPSEICYQSTIEISNDNGIISHEVVAADCITGWEAECRSDCAASVGETFQTFDPLGLVGG